LTAAATLILATQPDHDSALRLASALVNDRLAARVSIGAPVESIYHSRGKGETAKEMPVTIKSHRACFATVEKAIGRVHPHELPGIIGVPFIDG